MNDTLLELYLADNKLMPTDGIQLGNLLRYNFTLQLLDVRNNHLQDVGVSHICDGLWEQNLGQGLATIVLWNNQVTYQAMNSLSRALMNTRSLETLNLGHNNITNEGIHRLKDGLLRNKSLLRIGLQASKISCEGAVALAEFIAESPRLRRIDLRENDIKTGGLMALSLSLKVSQSVTRIDLDKETKRETSMKDYAEQQQRLMNDINNYMQRNRELFRQQEEQKEREQQQQQQQQQQENKEEKSTDKTSEQIQQTSDVNNVKVMDTVDVSGKTGLENLTEEHPTEDMVNDDFIGILQQHFQRPDKLDLNSSRGPHTLDSPAFLCDSALATFSESLQLESELNTKEETSSKNVQVFFPPSPMVSDNGRPTLTPVLGAAPSVISPETPDSMPSANSLLGAVHSSAVSKEVLRKSPCSSPTTKRKFIISRVQEPTRFHVVGQPTASSPFSSCSDDTASSPDDISDAGVKSDSGLATDVVSNTSTSDRLLTKKLTHSANKIMTPDFLDETPVSEEVDRSAKEGISPDSEEVDVFGTEVGRPSQEVRGLGTQVTTSPGSDEVSEDKPEMVSSDSDVSGLLIKEVGNPTSREVNLLVIEGTNSTSQKRSELRKEIQGITSNNGNESARDAINTFSGEVSGLGTEEVVSTTSIDVRVLGTDEECDHISESNQPSSSLSPVTNKSVKMTDSCKIQNVSGVTMPNPRAVSRSETESGTSSSGVDPTDLPEERILSDVIVADSKSSQRVSECTKTASEFSSMNGVSQNIANIRKTSDFIGQHVDCDTSENLSSDCSIPEKSDSFERELEVMLSNLSDSASS